MNILPIQSAVIATALFCTSALHASIWSADFGDSDTYPESQTIIGVAGWKNSGGSSSGSTNAIIVEEPSVSSDNLLRLRKSTGSDAPVRVLNDSFAPITGEIRFSVAMAFNFNPATNSGTKTNVAFTDLWAVGSPFLFGMDYAAGGGLFYRGSSDTATVFLSKDNIRMGSIYNFTLDINIPDRKVNLTVTGTNPDDSAYSETFLDIDTGIFRQSSNPRIDLVYIETTANQNFTTYVSRVGFEPIPEPSTAMLFLGAGAAMGLFRLCR